MPAKKRSPKPKKRAASKRAPKKWAFRPKQKRKWLRILFTTTLILSVIGLLIALCLWAYYAALASKFDLTVVGQMPERSVVLSADGQELGRLHGENRTVVPIDQISDHFLDALLIREDARFYDHGGVDFKGVARAAFRNLKAGRTIQGASTLTMQLARNSFGMRERTLHRKVLEVALARRIEKNFKKIKILELYANRIFFGRGLYGIEKASQVYFGKPATDLSLGEGATLAGIIRSPNRLSPIRHMDSALNERDVVLDRMVLKKVITEEASEAAKSEAIVLKAHPFGAAQSSYAMEAVRRDMDLVLTENYIEDGGLRIHTTLHMGLQEAARLALDDHLTTIESEPGYRHITKSEFDASIAHLNDRPNSTPYVQGAVVAIDNSTGGILALVGGRDHSQSVFNRAELAKRSAGSTFKAFVFAQAFDSGLLPGTTISDDPIRPGELRQRTGNWSPRNSDGKHIGSQPAELGLIRSRNTMSVRVGDYAGLDNIADIAARAVVIEAGDAVQIDPQLSIGNLATTPKLLTSAFSIFPNRGIRRRPFLIDRIEDRDGNLIYQSGVLAHEVISPAAAELTDRVLSKVIEPGGTGTAVRSLGFTAPAGAKTGTTDDYRDAWFVGYSGGITCGVWVGLDLPARITDRGYGGRLALPVWVGAMQHAETAGLLDRPMMAKLPSSTVALCRLTGQRATTGCSHAGQAYSDTLPNPITPPHHCQLHPGSPTSSSGVNKAIPYSDPTTPAPTKRRSLWQRIFGG